MGLQFHFVVLFLCVGRPFSRYYIYCKEVPFAVANMLREGRRPSDGPGASASSAPAPAPPAPPVGPPPGARRY